MKHLSIAAWACLAAVLTSRPSPAALPSPPSEMADWAMPWGAEVPGVVSAQGLISKPAGRNGPVTVREGHFYEGNSRLRFWGMSIAFSGVLPTHAQADAVADRLRHFGINAVRFHHMDMFPFPNGLFADKSLEKLSPEALDRLDYFISTLKAQGIYSDLNLHVSRVWSRAHHWENADKLPELDKMVDLFDPRLIAADKQYARDLLTHVNPYTHTRLADEPAVCFLEINNENTLFLWGGEQKLAELPEPYAGRLDALWNRWLTRKYPSRQAIADAWSAGAKAAGPNLLKNPNDASAWFLEQDGATRASHGSLSGDPSHPGVSVDIAAVDGTSWHVQLSQGKLTLHSGVAYSVSFDARADQPKTLEVGVGQAHDPWNSLGLSAPVSVGPKWKHYHFGLTCTAADDNARVSFILGRAVGRVSLANIALAEGGQQGLMKDEDPSRGTVARGFPDEGFTPARLRDWYDFLQQTDADYFVEMRRFLKDDLGVKCPITGTIGLGPLGTLSQSKMDFVDAHAYWDHPSFPHRQWDPRDWQEKNLPMVDAPPAATLWELAGTRVAGKPFTVTEYNHAAPNDWQAECIPVIASYAALQDWDGVFLFDYVGSNQYEKLDHTSSYFDIEGNPQKMDLLPAGARIFMSGTVKPLAGERLMPVARRQMLDTGSKYYWTIWPFERDVLHVTPEEALRCRLALSFTGGTPTGPCSGDPRVDWTGNGPGTGSGRFVLRDPHAAVFAGFASGPQPIDLGPVRIEKLQTPFATLTVCPADASGTIDRAGRLIVTAVARGGNTGMRWDASRHTVSADWGHAPPLVEVVQATISLASTRTIHAYALTPEGNRGNELPVRTQNGRATIDLGGEKTIWYELVR